MEIYKIKEQDLWRILGISWTIADIFTHRDIPHQILEFYALAYLGMVRSPLSRYKHKTEPLVLCTALEVSTLEDTSLILMYFSSLF